MKVRFSVRDLFWLVLVVGMGCTWYFDHVAQRFAALSLRFHSQQLLHADATQEICVTEHYKPGFIGLPVWQVWSRPIGMREWQALFTVERGFQEAEPANPIAIETSNGVRISDSSRSYEFDPVAKTLVRNSFLAQEVYAGPFRCSRPPD